MSDKQFLVWLALYLGRKWDGKSEKKTKIVARLWDVINGMPE